MSRRVEVAFPIETTHLKQRVINEILAITLADNVKARILHADGSYTRVPRDLSQPAVRSQERFLELAVQNAQKRLDVALPPAAPMALPAARPARVRKRTTRGES
ncbi:MAG: hypothetical protein U0744_15465 [Gemmataceae bacterium]